MNSANFSIILKPEGNTFEVELDFNTVVRELYEYFKEGRQPEIDQWTCFSVQRQKYLDIKDKIGNFQNDVLTINTQPVPNQQLNLSQNTINLFINIQDGHTKKAFQGRYSLINTLQDVAQSILAYCQLSQHQQIATVDLFIFDQPYNEKVKREKSLSDLSIKNNLTIEAKIRWFGGL